MKNISEKSISTKKMKRKVKRTMFFRRFIKKIINNETEMIILSL